MNDEFLIYPAVKEAESGREFLPGKTGAAGRMSLTLPPAILVMIQPQKVKESYAATRSTAE